MTSSGQRRIVTLSKNSIQKKGLNKKLAKIDKKPSPVTNSRGAHAEQKIVFMGTGVGGAARTSTAASIAIIKNQDHENENHEIRRVRVWSKCQTSIQEISCT